jgi:hypothetical protein
LLRDMGDKHHETSAWKSIHVAAAAAEKRTCPLRNIRPL